MNDIRYIKVQSEKEYASALNWARAQPEHERIVFEPGSTLWAAVRDNEIVAVIQLASIPVLTAVFSKDLKAGTTARMYDSIMSHMDMDCVYPVIACNETSPLFGYIERIFKPVWGSLKFFKR